MRVGFIGLGGMGLPMARRVLAGGFPLIAAPHRRREPADELAALGATVAATPADVARLADAIITIVPADKELREVALGPNGLLEAFAPGKILIDMTTGTPGALREIEEALATRGGRVLDAPVSGGPTGAEKGTLTIMAGGDAALLEEVRPLLAAMGTNIIHVGGVGQGKLAKIVNQIMAAVNLLVMGEAFALGVRGGADPRILFEVIKASSGYSRMADARLPKFLFEGSFQPGFKLDLMKKDVNLGLEAAKNMGIPVLFASLAAQVFAAASAAGRGLEDFAAAADFLAGLAGAHLNPPGKG